MREILDLDSRSAATIFSFIKIPRDNPREELGMVELENCLSQAIWKMFDGIRERISERLNVDGADLLLTDARVIGIKVDGHQIINPSGFTGKELEILLSVTMVRRDKFVEDKELFEEHNKLFDQGMKFLKLTQEEWNNLKMEYISRTERIPEIMDKRNNATAKNISIIMHQENITRLPLVMGLLHCEPISKILRERYQIGCISYRFW